MEVRGTDHLAVAPAILAAKHQSMFETIALSAIVPRACFVLKKELRKIPVFGLWCARCGFIFVDRKAGATALRDMLAQAKQKLTDGVSHIIIFPEGTRTEPGTTAPYQPGVAALSKSLSPSYHPIGP